MKTVNLQSQLDLFSEFADAETAFARIEAVGPSIYRLQSKAATKSNVTLGFLALVHGNEIIGLPILNTLIKSILAGELAAAPSDIYFALGNIPAALANTRYVEEDLNRCFGTGDTKSQEAKRARELETLMLDHCDFLIDLHQTVSPAHNPFFIFQYASSRCLSMMEKWNPGLPTILQQEQIGNNTGLSTDEYLRSRGKFGTALELGQLGTAEHFELGLEICKNATLGINDEPTVVEPGKLSFLELSGSYRIKESSYQLDGGWKNLMPFNEGDRLGSYNGGIIVAPVSGYMLFPRYRKLEAGQELFYYCTDFSVPSSYESDFKAANVLSSATK